VRLPAALFLERLAALVLRAGPADGHEEHRHRGGF
jgi:hypothetical protein